MGLAFLVGMLVVFLGPPGSGKGTYADLLQERMGLRHVSMGELLRRVPNGRSAFSLRVKRALERGRLLSFADVSRVLFRFLDKNGFERTVLDGFPRTLAQARNFDKLLEGRGAAIARVVFLDTSKNIIVRRLASRLTCSKCGQVFGEWKPPKNDSVCDACKTRLTRRADDQPTVVRARFKVFERQTKPLVAYYKKKGLLARVNGNARIETVYRRIEKALKPLLGAR